MFRKASNSKTVTDRQAGGFALAETLVAIAILAVVISYAYSTFAAGWRAQHWIDGENGAVAVANARLAAAGIETPLQAGTLSGTEGAYDWRLDIARYDTPTKSATPARITAWWVSVEVSFSDHTSAAPRIVKLTTLKLGGASK